MDTFDDLRTALRTAMNIDTNSTLYDANTVDLALNQAKWKAEGLYAWPELQDAQKTSAVNGQENYDYPQRWRSMSIWRLSVDGLDYGPPLALKDYLYEIDNNFPNGQKNIWTNQGRQYFIRPIPTVDGDNNIAIWGLKTTDKLANGTDTTIWSYSLPECNVAIVQEATAILKGKGEDLPSDQFYDQGALKTLMAVWQRISSGMAQQQKTKPMFNVPDFFSTQPVIQNDDIGEFDI